MADTSNTILYQFTDKPSWCLSITIGLQYVVKFSILLSLIMLLMSVSHISGAQRNNFLSLTLIFAAISTLLQTSKHLGSEIVFPAVISVPYYAPILLASQSFGWSYALGMTLIASLVQLILVPILKRLRLVSPTLIIIIIFFIATWLCELGIKQILYNDQLGQLVLHAKAATLPTAHLARNSYYILIGVLSVIVILYAYQSKIKLLRENCLLLGTLIGYLLLHKLPIPTAVLALINNSPVFSLPRIHLGQLSFAWSLLPYFLAAAFVSAFEIIALVSLYERASNEQQNEALNYKRANRCNTLTAIMNIITVFFGIPPNAPVPGSIGNGLLTGVLSKRIAYVYAIILLALSFSPKCTLWLMTIPACLNGAALIVLGFILMKYSIFFLRMSDIFSDKLTTIANQKIFIIAITIGCAIYILPNKYQKVVSLFGFTNPGLVFSIVSYLILGLLLALFKDRSYEK